MRFLYMLLILLPPQLNAQTDDQRLELRQYIKFQNHFLKAHDLQIEYSHFFTRKKDLDSESELKQLKTLVFSLTQIIANNHYLRFKKTPKKIQFRLFPAKSGAGFIYGHKKLQFHSNKKSVVFDLYIGWTSFSGYTINSILNTFKNDLFSRIDLDPLIQYRPEHTIQTKINILSRYANDLVKAHNIKNISFGFSNWKQSYLDNIKEFNSLRDLIPATLVQLKKMPSLEKAIKVQIRPAANNVPLAVTVGVFTLGSGFAGVALENIVIKENDHIIWHLGWFGTKSEYEASPWLLVKKIQLHLLH